MARPGKIVIQGASVMKSRPWAMMLPKDGAGGGGPTPMNDRAASARIAVGKHVGEAHDQRAEGVRQHVAEQDPRFRTAPSARAASTYSSSRTTSTEARTMRAVCGIVAMDSAMMTFDHRSAEHRRDRDGKHDGRERHQGIHQPHDGIVEGWKVTGGGADERPGDAGQQCGHQPDDQRNPRAVDDARENVAAEMVRAEPEGRVRRPRRVRKLLRRGSKGEQDVGEDGDEHDGENEHRADQERAVLKQPHDRDRGGAAVAALGCRDRERSFETHPRVDDGVEHVHDRLTVR